MTAFDHHRPPVPVALTSSPDLALVRYLATHTAHHRPHAEDHEQDHPKQEGLIDRLIRQGRIALAQARHFRPPLTLHGPVDGRPHAA